MSLDGDAEKTVAFQFVVIVIVEEKAVQDASVAWEKER